MRFWRMCFWLVKHTYIFALNNQALYVAFISSHLHNIQNTFRMIYVHRSCILFIHRYAYIIHWWAFIQVVNREGNMLVEASGPKALLTRIPHRLKTFYSASGPRSSCDVGKVCLRLPIVPGLVQELFLCWTIGGGAWDGYFHFKVTPQTPTAIDHV